MNAVPVEFMFRENKFLLFGGRYFSLAFLERESEDPSQAYGFQPYLPGEGRGYWWEENKKIEIKLGAAAENNVSCLINRQKICP